MRTRRMKSGVLLVWIEALEKHQRAQHTHCQSVMRSYLQRWQCHTQHSVCVRAVCAWLQGMREERSLRWGLRVWRGRLRLRLRRRERVWQSVAAVALLWRERALESRAQRHREERLTLLARQCLTAWSDYAKSVCVERVLVCEFEEERKMMMKSRALAVWRQRAEIRWVERHYNSRLLGGALHLWMSALIGRRRSRESALVAARVWRQKTLPSRELMERAEEFQWQRHMATLTHCFSHWRMAYTHTRISQDFHRRTVCNRVLLAWQHYTETTQRNQYKEAWLQCAREQRLLRACFTRWLEALCQAGLRQAALEQRLCQLERRRVARSLQYWRAATRGREAHRRRSRSMLQQCFSVWRESTEELCVAEYLRVEHERRTAREALNTWFLWTKDRRAQRMMVDAMWMWLDGRRVSRSFHQWLRAHRRHQEASQHHNKLLLCRAFQGWRSVCEDRWRRTALSQRAEQVCVVRVCEARKRGVLRAALSIWRKKFQARRRLRVCEGVFSHWLQLVHRRRTVRQAQTQHKDIQRYWCVWRERVQERTSQARLLQLHWACWKNRTAVSLIVSTMHNDSVQQRAWLVWRKKRIRNRVAQGFSANLNRALLSEAFTEWRRLTLYTG
ncbi:protein SFI1 homolog [Sardina pilchardus]|uniref:protein SFI1 homolog n=1 Tax=Sardina pilchardus TaxID=27697 RepID=UPI002E0EB894